jgi:GNAT superfamily N-acetyltransferase
MLENEPKIVSALVEALEGDPFYVAISCDFGGDPAKRTQALRSYFDYSMTEGFQIGRCVLMSDVLGAAIWSLPALARARAEKGRFVSGVLGKRGLDNYLRIVDFMKARAKTVVPKDAWYLSVLGVAPSEQGKGLGARLLAPTLAEADHHGASCYLETFASQSRRFYSRAGFEDVAHFREPITNAEYYLMQRTPKIG